MLPGFVTRGPVVGEAEVAAFEGRCGFALPADYRQFLLDQNGGDRPVQPGEPDDDEDEPEGGVVRFFSLGAAVTLEVPVAEVTRAPEAWPEEWQVLMADLELRMEGGRDHGTRSYPPELLPVADTPVVGVLLLRLKGRGTGGVYHCPDPEGYEPGHVSRVAKSFAELLRDLDDFTWG